MDNRNEMPMPPSTSPTQPPVEPTPTASKKSEHWLVEVAGGVALGSTLMAALALWTVLVAQMFYA